MMIFNLTQHPATADQIAEGVIDPETELQQRIRKMLTFTALPSRQELETRANDLAVMASAWFDGHGTDHGHAMIGGAPYLMAPLEASLQLYRIVPVFAFSKRESMEQEQSDGSVQKVNVFRHLGFIMGEDNAIHN